ncbi:lantibiotic dehydratase [Streptomyces johnsoniae]|uniref:Lantibiotic dehydratase n=1 Tax=Streptomyces johnsoniae TaxID=3075532 RepID=A0ABU2SDT5_9ACTN|nr:lantibiotic dehydratase [Streptomyces sp. DSM 41886]MDT0447137.1 lantibiotic dehydratase [Streptomyces sp. DSM 41886]
MLRIPLLPYSWVERTVTAAEGLDPRDRAQVERYVATLIADERVREALLLSSPSLYRAIRTLQAGEPMKPAALRKLALGTTRYVLRAAGRPTPFGLLAGVAPVAFGDACRARVGERHRVAVRPDGDWLVGLLSAWERDPALLRKLRVITNDLGFARGDRWVLPFTPVTDEGRAAAARTKEVSVRHTAAVRLALEAAEQPCTGGEIAERLTSAFPTVAAGKVDGLLADLVRRGFLLTELRPPLARADPLRYVREVLASVADREKEDAVARIAKVLADCAGAPLGAGTGRWDTAERALWDLHRHDGTLQTDLRIDAEVILPEAVAREAESAATALWRASAKNERKPHLADYHRAFVERYGVGHAVPLLEVLDPHSGLGPPAGYENPGGERRMAPAAADDRGPARDAVLTDLVLSAAAGSGEIVLGDAVLNRLADAAPDTTPTPAELCAQVTAVSQEALARGEFRLILSQTTGSPTPGALFGRFAYLFDDPEPVAALARDAMATTLREGATPVSLDFQVLPGAANVTRALACWPDRLTVGSFPHPSSEGRVRGARDVALAADEERLFSVDAATGRELVAHTATVLSMGFTSDAVRLLREISSMGRPTWSVWDWGTIGSATRLPRVRHGRTVLTPARWKMTDPALTDSSASDEEWGRALDAWRARWAVPRRVNVGTVDLRVVLDLSAPLHRTLLRRQLARDPGTVAYETLEDAGYAEHWLRDDEGGAYRSEVLIPVLPRGRDAGTARAPAGMARRGPAPRQGNRHRQWYYAKLYLATAGQNEVLVSHLPRLLANLPDGGGHWFFIRYIDPEPHLRLRCPGDPRALLSDVAPAVQDWADDLYRRRLAGRLVVDRYEPETVRYGGPGAIAAAERFFHHDSRTVVGQLAALSAGTVATPPPVLAAGHYVDIARQVHGPDWPAWFLAMPREEEHHRYFREHRDEALGLLGTAPLPGTSASGPAGLAERAAALRDFPAASRRSVLAGVLHMHHNRLIGANRTSEERSFAVARGMAQTEQARREHLR